ncbi:uncharacterized protein N7496_006389 [Penicillium cataractarum]|uniref:Uncharacterized protein n=1 Tax=Penicillium cataractarum TaxID=2100454 RepID=A0A9W9S1E8_9EURO|nr:uncharacterized protein N7496_006389 [Penicillium cataractarum]KAJ5370297.1 hypothetical protein N7496_006389 [Penicillium cataractarum]
MDDDFDPFTDFGKLVQQTQQPASSKKRTTEDAFGGDIEFSSSKRQSREPSNAAETLVQPTNIDTIGQASIASISSHTPTTTLETPTSTTTAKDQFALKPESLARVAAVAAFTQAKSSSRHISPYAPVGYYPSAPNLHCMIGGGPDSNESLRSRLHSSRRRLDVVMAERNKYRDALLKYDQVDPATGMLGIQQLEAEVQKLRRTASNHRYRVDHLKAEGEDWKAKYIALANTHNCLIRDYQQLQATTRLPPRALEAPAEAAFTSPQGNPQGIYAQSSQASTDMCAAYVQSLPDPSGIKSSVIPPASPFSIPSPAQTFEAPTPHCDHSPGSDTRSPPTLYEDHHTPLPPPQLEDPATDLQHSRSEDLPPNFLTPLSAQSPPGEPNTMATNYAHSTSSGRGGYVPPILPGQATRLLQNAGIAFYMPTTTANMPAPRPVATTHATGATINTLVDLTAATPVATVSAPTVPPKDVVVIDLTSDSDTDVSPQGSNTPSPTPLTKEPSPLATFRLRFREKKLTWLHESNSSDADHAVAERICKNLNSSKRKRDRGKEFVATNFTECYSHVQAQKHVRWALGGPLTPLTGAPSSSAVVAKGGTPPYSITDDEFARQLEEAMARGKTPEKDGVAANTTTSPPEGSSASVVEAKGDTSPPYHITDDEFVQLMEESLARGKNAV